MVGWEDVYKVVVGVVPLYFALVLGYGSLKWWKIFTRDQCESINKFVCYFTLPLFTFEFTTHIDPFKMNYSFIAADTISKLIIMVVLALWAKCTTKCSFYWSITCFCLCTLTNALVVGVPMVKPMYGALGVDLVVQSSVVQAIIWLTSLLFILEFRKIGLEDTTTIVTTPVKSGSKSSTIDNNSNDNVTCEGGEGKERVETTIDVQEDLMLQKEEEDIVINRRPPLRKLMKHVWIKLVMNPNIYACVLGLAWAFIANRWNLELPSMIEGSIQIMSKAGTGTAMFSMGIFMALQEKLIACGPSLTVFGLVLKFIAGPASMAIGAITVGLHGDVFKVAIIQAALPQSITSFIYAKEYGLRPEILSTAVIFGMIVSLPVLVAYYAILESML